MMPTDPITTRAMIDAVDGGKAAPVAASAGDCMIDAIRDREVLIANPPLGMSSDLFREWLVTSRAFAVGHLGLAGLNYRYDQGSHLFTVHRPTGAAVALRSVEEVNGYLTAYAHARQDAD